MIYIYLRVSVLIIALLYWRTSSSFSMMSALRKNSQTLTGEPKKATCPLQSRRILSKAWKISLLGWWMVTTTALPVPAISWRLLRISREEAESRPIRNEERWVNEYKLHAQLTDIATWSIIFYIIIINVKIFVRKTERWMDTIMDIVILLGYIL